MYPRMSIDNKHSSDFIHRSVVCGNCELITKHLDFLQEKSEIKLNKTQRFPIRRIEKCPFPSQAFSLANGYRAWCISYKTMGP